MQHFALGLVAEPESNGVDAHVEQCARCCAMLDTLDRRDSTLIALRAADSVGNDREIEALEPLMARIRHSFAAIADSPHGIDCAGSVVYDFLEPAMEPDELGRLGDYRVLEVIGSGGMGVVFRALDSRLSRSVALKVILERRRLAAHHIERFRREAATLARLQHPNIVQVYEVGEYRGRPFLALELVSGGTLADRLAKGTIPVRHAATLLAILSRAVHYAHEHGIVHRDLKPSNVLLHGADEDIPKIADFGLAKRLDEEGMTQSGELLGTPEYMAPEIAAGESPRSGVLVDVYALGAILYETLTGLPPFRGANALETLEQLRELDPIAPRRLRPGIPLDVETICLKCLSREPRDRYASAADLADDLDRFLGNKPVLARPISLPGRTVRFCRRRPALAALLVLSLLSLLAGIAGVAVHEARMQVTLDKLTHQQAQTLAEKDRLTDQYRAATNTIHDMLRATRTDAARVASKSREVYLQQSLAALDFFRSQQAADPGDEEARYQAAHAARVAALACSETGRQSDATSLFREALDLFQALLKQNPADMRSAEGEAECQLWLGRSAPAASEAETRLRAAMAAYDRLAQPEGDNRYDDKLAVIHYSLGVLRMGASKLAEAEDHLQSAVRLSEAPSDLPLSASQQNGLVEIRLMLAKVLTYRKKYGDADQQYHNAQGAIEALRREAPNNLQYLTTDLQLRLGKAWLAQEQGRTEEAIDRASGAIELATPLSEADPADAALRGLLLNAHNFRADLRAGLGRHSEATPDFERGVQLSESDNSVARRRLARNLVAAGQYTRAMNEAGELARSRSEERDNEFYWDLAVVAGLASTAVTRDAGFSDAERERLRQQYADQCIAWLQRVRALAPPAYWHNHRSRAAAEPAFATLQNRADFIEVFKEL